MNYVLQYVTDINFEEASLEWNRNKSRDKENVMYEYNNNESGDGEEAAVYEDDDNDATKLDESHASLMDRIKTLGVNDQKAIKHKSFDEIVEARIRAQRMPKTIKGLNDREDRLNAIFVIGSQQEYLLMRRLTKTSGELVSNYRMIRESDGNQRKRTLKEQQQMQHQQEQLRDMESRDKLSQLQPTAEGNPLTTINSSLAPTTSTISDATSTTIGTLIIFAKTYIICH